MRFKVKGFTLIELMITLTIVAILAAIAIPSYLLYTRRSHYSEVVESVAPFKSGVVQCFEGINTLTGCDGGSNHVPPNITSPTGAVASLTVSSGVITVTPVAQNGILSTDTFILTPTITNSTTLTWTESGGGVSNGYAQ